MESVLLIVNPAARSAAKLERRAVEEFAAANIRVRLVRTERPGHARELARDHATGYDAVFTLGGDGTVMEVVSALTTSGPPVGVLPGGTGNLIARALGTSTRIRRAVRSLINGDEAIVDLGVLSDGRRFAFAAGVGIDVAMIERAPAKLKRRIGVLAYVLAAAGAMFRARPFKIRITVDGQTIERKALAAMVVNFGVVLEGLLTFGPGIKQDDGLLDVLVFSPGSFWDLLRIVWRMYRRDFRKDVCVLYSKGREIRIETNPPMMAQADGELIGMTPLAITTAPRAARLLTPRGA